MKFCLFAVVQSDTVSDTALASFIRRYSDPQTPRDGRKAAAQLRKQRNRDVLEESICLPASPEKKNKTKKTKTTKAKRINVRTIAYV